MVELLSTRCVPLTNPINMRKFFFYLMVVFYVAGGINHFVNPEFYLAIMPKWMPWHEFLVQLSGVAEIVLGLLLLPKATRSAAAWLIISMLIVFFTVHIDMIYDFYVNDKPYFWLTIVRIPIQFLFIAWAYAYTKPSR